MKGEIRRDIIIALAENHPRDLSIGEITKETGRARGTVKKYLRALAERGYVEESRTVGRAKMFEVGPKLKDIVDSQGGDVIDDILQIAE